MIREGLLPEAVVEHDYRQGVSLVIYAYGDDGTDAKKERVLAVSIIAGYEDWWKQAEIDWTARCGGVPFHATDCENDRGDYANIPHLKNKELYRDLTGILAASKLGGIASAIDLQAKKKVFPNTLDLAYYRAFLDCLVKVTNVAQSTGEIVEITFDISSENEYNAGLLYSQLRGSEEEFSRWLHPKISFVSWKESARVQMADLLAYEGWKALDHAVGPKKRVRKSWEVLRSTDRFETFALSEDWFKDLKAHMGELRGKVGFTQADYIAWLKNTRRQHCNSSLIHFLDYQDRKQSEFEKFDETTKRLLKTPHSELKAKLDEERAEKKKRKRVKRSSASREAGEKV